MSVFEGLKEMASSALDTLARNADALRNAPTALQKAVVNNPRVIAVADSIISSAEQSVQSIQKETQGYRQAIAQEGLVKGAAFRTMENIGRTTDAMMESDVAPVALAGNILNRAKLMAVDGIAQGAADTLTGTKDAFVTVGTGIGEGIAKAVVSLEQKGFTETAKVAGKGVVDLATVVGGTTHQIYINSSEGVFWDGVGDFYGGKLDALGAAWDSMEAHERAKLLTQIIAGIAAGQLTLASVVSKAPGLAKIVSLTQSKIAAGRTTEMAVKAGVRAAEEMTGLGGGNSTPDLVDQTHTIPTHLTNMEPEVGHVPQSMRTEAANGTTQPDAQSADLVQVQAANDAMGIQMTGTDGVLFQSNNKPTMRLGANGDQVVFQRNGENVFGFMGDTLPDGRVLVFWPGKDPITGKEGVLRKAMNPKDLRSANDPEFSPVNTPDISATTPSVTLLDGSTIQSLGDGGWVHFGKTPDGKDFRHTYDENLPAELQARYDRELKAQDKIALVDAPIAPDKLGRFVDNCELGSSVEILTNNGSRYIFQKLSDTLFRLTQTTNIGAQKALGIDANLTITSDGRARFGEIFTTSSVERAHVGADRGDLAERMVRAEENSGVLRREVLENAALSPEARALKANEILQKLSLGALTPEQMQVVQRVHDEISRGVYANGIGDLRAMTRAMDNATPPISREQQRVLIEHGICGKLPVSPERLLGANTVIDTLRPILSQSHGQVSSEAFTQLVDAFHILRHSGTGAIAPHQLFGENVSQQARDAWERATRLGSFSIDEVVQARKALSQIDEKLNILQSSISRRLANIPQRQADLAEFYQGKTQQLDADFRAVKDFIVKELPNLRHSMTDTNVMEGFSSEWKAIIDKIQAQTDSLSRLRGELGALRSTPEHTAARDAAKQAETLQVETHTGVATRTPEEVTRELGSASMKDMSEISKVLENMQKFPGLDANTQAILGQLYATAGENGIGTLLDEIVHFRKKTLPKLSPLVQTTFDDVLKKMTAALDDM